MKCTKCGQDAPSPVLFKSETLCVSCGFTALEKAKEAEAAINDLVNDLEENRKVLAAAVTSLEQATAAAEKAQEDLEKSKEERDYLLNKIEEIEAKLLSLRG